LSFSADEYLHQLDFLNRAEEIAEMAARHGLILWSIHLPFSQAIDISVLDDADRNAAIQLDLDILEAAARAGIRVAVVHPSSEPIFAPEREQRLENSRQSLRFLAEQAHNLNIRLAVEDLPRTCLGNCSDEIELLLQDNPHLSVCFDTNHLLFQDNVAFVEAIGSRIITLHVSDYDFIDERHLLPGEGKNNWTEIVDALERVDYAGPWMYEVGSRGKITLKDLQANRRCYVDDNREVDGNRPSARSR
jgi:sugar phosphate isomerase/epimerase